MASPEQSKFFPEQVLYSPSTGITDAGLDHIIKSETPDRLSFELSGSLPGERTTHPVLPRMQGAINSWGPDGEHTVRVFPQKEKPLIRTTEIKNVQSELISSEPTVVFKAGADAAGA